MLTSSGNWRVLRKMRLPRPDSRVLTRKGGCSGVNERSNTMNAAEAFVHVLLDSARDRYVPQGFTERIDRSQVDKVSDEDWHILATGPEIVLPEDEQENEAAIEAWRKGLNDPLAIPENQYDFYWETWDYVEQNAVIWWDGRGEGKKPYTLFINENGDVLLVRDDIFYDDLLDEWRFKDQKRTLDEVLTLAFKAMDHYSLVDASKEQKQAAFREVVGDYFDLDTEANLA